jgi:hypothetical protein
MALKDVEAFLTRCATDGAFRTLFTTKPDDAFKAFPGLDANEQELLKRRDAHEIKDHMKDAYGAALTVHIS